MTLKELRKFVKKTRKRMQQVCPFVYEQFFSHLSDEEFIENMNRNKRVLELNKGEEIGFALQHPDGKLEVLDIKFSVPREEGIN
jgi:hypothetical protein